MVLEKRMEIEKKRLSAKHRDLPTLWALGRLWGGGQKGVLEGAARGATGNPEERCALEAKCQLAFFFSLYSYKGKNQHTLRMTSISMEPFEGFAFCTIPVRSRVLQENQLHEGPFAVGLLDECLRLQSPLVWAWLL